MANQIHRNLTQGELHRPERTGSGSPDGQSFSFLEDGQYYQDIDTGSLWRYRASAATWEQLIQYDRSTGRVTNVTTGVAVQATSLGATTTIIVPGPVSAVGARLVTPIREGEDIKIISSANDDFVLHLNVSETTDTGDVTINVQPTKSVYTIPVGSSIVLESGLQGAYDSVDPTKLERKVSRTTDATSIGLLNLPLGSSADNVTTLSLQSIAEGISLRDGQILLIQSANGFSQSITVDGDQTLSSPYDNLIIKPFDPLVIYQRGRTNVYEPSYKQTTRITQTENSIELQAQQISNLGNFTSTLNVAVNNNSAQIGLITEAQVGQNVTIAGLEANASAQQATLVLLAEAQAGQNNAIATLQANATDQQATLTLLASAQNAQANAISALELNATAQQATLSLLAQANEDQNLAIAAINATANAQEASISLLTQVTSTHNVQIEDLNTNVIQLIGDVGTLNTELTTQNIAIAALQLNATAQQATLSLLSATQSSQGNSIAALELNASAQQATLSLLSSTQTAQGNAIAALELNASAQQATIGLLAATQNAQANSIASLQLNASAQQATINTSVQYNDAGAYIRLLAGPAGSEITLQANQINIDGVVTFINDIATTTIDGDRITTGTITASQINVGDLFSETIEVGNVVKSNNYAVGSTGFAVYANGTAEFRDVVVDGQIITGAGSALDGSYVSNINAGTIVVGTISADRIGANTIVAEKIGAGAILADKIFAGAVTAEKIDAGAVTTEKLSANAVTAAKINVADLYATNATVNGTLTIDAGKLITKDAGNYVEVSSAGIRGVSSILGETFKIPTDGSEPIFSSGRIFQTAFLIGTNAVLRTSNNALQGDAGVLINNTGIFAGNADQNTGNANFRVSSADGSLVAQSATISGALTAGAGSSISGLYVYDLNANNITAGTLQADRINVSGVISSGSIIVTGDNVSDLTNDLGFTDFDATDVQSAIENNVTSISGNKIVTGTIDAANVNVINLNASQITTGTIDAARINTNALFAQSVTVSNTINIGSTTSPMVIGVGQGYGVGEVGDGIKINPNNYWFFSTSEELPVFRVGDSGNYVHWTGSQLDVRGTLNASDIKSGVIDGIELKITDGISIKETGATTASISGSTGTIEIDSQSVKIVGTGSGYGLQTFETGVVTVASSSGVALGFFGSTGFTKRTVTGSTGGNAALQSLLQALEDYGLITDSTT